MTPKAAISYDFWGSFLSFLAVDRIVSCGVELRPEVTNHFLSHGLLTSWQFTSFKSVPEHLIYLISSDSPRIITLLINSKSIDLRTLFIFKIPSSLSISIGQKEFTGLRHTEGKGIFQDLNTQGRYHREPILEYFLPYWVTIFPRYMSYSMYFISYV